MSGSPFLQNKSHPYGFPNAGTNQNVSEKPIIIAEAVLFLRASKDNKDWLLNQNHMDRDDDNKSSNTKLLAVVECEAHMSPMLSHCNHCSNDFLLFQMSAVINKSLQ